MCVHTKNYVKTKKFIKISVLARTGSSPFAEVKEYDCDVYITESSATTYFISEIKTDHIIFRAPINLVVCEIVEKIIQD